jgi:hypothetical protein
LTKEAKDDCFPIDYGGHGTLPREGAAGTPASQAVGQTFSGPKR